MSSVNLLAPEDMSSPEESVLKYSPILERLILYFVASKKSLVTTSHVSAASGIVVSARTSLEKIASLKARNAFCRSGINSQYCMLEAFQQTLENILETGEAEFRTLLRTLDAADTRVEETLQVLKDALLESDFRPNDSKAKYLIDFVDEQGVDELRKECRNSIDKVERAHKVFTEDKETLQREIQAVATLLSKCGSRDNDHHSPTLSGDFRTLEHHASELAKLLEALVTHYDLCVTAIKHTEGGGHLVEQVKNELPEGTDLRSIEHLGPSQSMSDEDRAEMMQVLDNDATEVHDVVQEIISSHADMHGRLQRINSQLESLVNEQVVLLQASRLLDTLGAKLSGSIRICGDYRSCSDIESVKVESKLDDFEAVREFYEGYWQSYDKLVLEVARRKSAEEKIRKIMQDAKTRMKLLYDEEVEERQAFKNDQGYYLPLDIWPGLEDAPTMYTFQVVEPPEGSKPALSDALTESGDGLR